MTAAQSSDTVTMYRLHSWKMEIQALHVIKQTECYITYRPEGSTHERRERKEGGWFATWEEAYEELLDKGRRELKWAQETLQKKRTALGQVEAMRKPT